MGRAAIRRARREILRKAVSALLAASMTFGSTPVTAIAQAIGDARGDEAIEQALEGLRGMEQVTSEDGSSTLEPIAYEIRWHSGEGEPDATEATVEDAPILMAQRGQEIEGMSFAGWATTADGQDAMHAETAEDGTESLVLDRRGITFPPDSIASALLVEVDLDQDGAISEDEVIDLIGFADEDGAIDLYEQWAPAPAPQAPSATAEIALAGALDEASRLAVEAQGIASSLTEEADQGSAVQAGEAEVGAPEGTSAAASDDVETVGDDEPVAAASAEPTGASEEEAQEDAGSEAVGELPASEAALVEDAAGNVGLRLSGRAAESRALALEALEQSAPGLADDEAAEIVAPLFKAAPLRLLGASPDAPGRSGDGTNIESVSIKWKDTDDALKHFATRGSTSPVTAVMRVDYALSGEHDYEPGDLSIIIPQNVFTTRDGNPTGSYVVPYPKLPNTGADWSWTTKDGSVVLTNNIAMRAATKGYVEISCTANPYYIQDMLTQPDVTATIQVTTHKGTLLQLESSAIMTRVDTEARLNSITKRASNAGVRWVRASSIPEELRSPGEDFYAIIDWVISTSVSGNQPYDATYTDELTDAYDGIIVSSSRGTISDDRRSVTSTGAAPTTIQVAYPASGLPNDVEHVVTNKVDGHLVERDPAIGGDPRLETSASANARQIIFWTNPLFKAPVGHFMTSKWGNDADSAYTFSSGWRSASSLNARNYANGAAFGRYPVALNDLRDGEDVEVSWSVNAIGYLLPWTYDGVSDPAMLSSYGKRAVTIVATDSYLNDDGRAADAWSPVRLQSKVAKPLSAELEPLVDYTLTSVEVEKPAAGIAKAVNLEEDGSFSSQYAGDGTIDYAPSKDASMLPDVLIEALVGDEWVEVGTVAWSSGSPVATYADGTEAQGASLDLPEGTITYRASVTSTAAYVSFGTYPKATLHATDKVMQIATDAFADDMAPAAWLWNSVAMRAYDADGSEVSAFDSEGRDRLAGFTEDTMAIPKKEAISSKTKVDYVNGKFDITYRAQVEERSFVGDREAYLEALAAGTIEPETSGTWYDLLPAGVHPRIDSIQLRSGDAVRDAYVVGNWRGSGRDLLVVECDLTPVASTYVYEQGVRMYQDVPEITFSATYDFASYLELGGTLHNVVAFESGKDRIGTVEHYEGEPDDPTAGMNTTTASAFQTSAERAAMTDLDADRDDEAFVYAGVTHTLQALTRAQSSLSKQVMVNEDGRWSQGTYDDERTVLEGGTYAYRLRMQSDSGTRTSDIILYDSLEAYEPHMGNDPKDVGAPTWQGDLIEVDMSQLIAAGIAPVLYYSTIDGLALSDESDPNRGNATNLDLGNASVWTRADQYAGDLADVHAIAIDCSRSAAGGSFVLHEDQSISAFVRMHAPWGDQPWEEGDARSARDYIDEGAHAFNNAYVTCLTASEETGTGERTNFIRHDYTKVGLKDNDIPVTKVWDDGDDADGLRPEGIVVRLLADGTDTGKSLTLDEGCGWSGTFESIPVTDSQGRRISYSFAEDGTAGYASSVRRNALTGEVTITNSHDPEKIDISGEKTWVGDDEARRPEFIVIKLMRDGREVARQIVRPSEDGQWSWTFEDVIKNSHGTPIAYEIEEAGDSDYAATVDGFDVTNTWHPFGDLVISKEIVDATSVSEQTEFSFEVRLIDGEDPVPGSFAWERSDGETGRIADGGTVTLKGGQSVRILEVPSHITATVTEADAPGFTSKGGAQKGAIIVGNRDNVIAYENAYDAHGSLELEMRKELDGRDLRSRQFRFYLEDENGKVVRSATNAPDGTISFPAIDFDEGDAGKTFRYTVREANMGRAGYTYDERTPEVIVSVADNGDGALEVTHEVTPEGFLFENEYRAEGQVTLRAWKALAGRDLEAGEFTFELLDEDGNVIQTKANDELGQITWDPISFDQDDAGKHFYFFAREVAGDDPTVTYDDAVFGYDVSVADNGDGTLSFAQGGVDATNRFVEGEPTEVEYRAGEFQMTGVEQISLGGSWPELPSGDFPGYEWRASGQEKADIVDALIWNGGINKLEHGDAPIVDDPYQTIYEMRDVEHFVLDGSFSSEVWTGSAPYEELAWSDDDLAADGFDLNLRNSGQFGADLPWAEAVRQQLLANGTLDEMKAIEYDGGATVTFADGEVAHVAPNDLTLNIKYGQQYYGNSCMPLFEINAKLTVSTPGELVPNPDWTPEATPELPVFENGLKPGSLAIQKHVADGTEGSFDFRVKLIGEDVPADGTYPVTREQIAPGHIAAGLIGTDGAMGIVGPVASALSDAWDAVVGLLSPTTAYAEDLSGMEWKAIGSFYDDGEGEWAFDETTGTLWLRPSDGAATGRLKQGHFGGGINYRGEWDWNADGLDDSILHVKVAPGHRLVIANDGYSHKFASPLANVETVDVSGMDFSQVTDMYGMFAGNRHLREIIGLETMETSQVTSMRGMFDGCYRLESLEGISEWDTSSLTDARYMFRYCYSLKSLEGISEWETSELKYAHYMFCSLFSLDGLDLSGWDTRKLDFTDGYGALFMMEAPSVAASVLGYEPDGIWDYLDLSGWDIPSERLRGSGSGLFDTDFYVREVTLPATAWEYVVSPQRSHSDYFTPLSYPVDPRMSLHGASRWKKADGSISGKNMQQITQGIQDDPSWAGTWVWDVEETEIILMRDPYDLAVSERVTVPRLGFDSWELPEYDLDDSPFECWVPIVVKRETGEDASSLMPLPLDYGGPSTWEVTFRANAATADPGEGISPLFVADLPDYENWNDASFIFVLTDGDGWCDLDDPELALAFYAKLKPHYTVTFHAGEGGAGSMPQAKVAVADDWTVPESAFARHGYELAGFSGSDGHVYQPGDVIASNTFADGDALTLTAMWAPVADDVELVDGEFTVTVAANERVTLDGIPAGTAYQVFEETPDGWRLVGESGTSGTIESLGTATASFENEYVPGMTSFRPTAAKTLDGEAAVEGAFAFELLEDGQVIQAVENSAGGSIAFDAIEYSSAGTHDYEIREVAGEDQGIDYDGTVARVTVTVTDNGDGTMSKQVSWADGEPPTFANATKPGAIRVEKSVEGATEATEDDVFSFDVALFDASGRPLADGTPVSWTFDGANHISQVASGKVTVMAAAGSPAELSGLPAGTRYDVEEQAPGDGWEALTASQDGTVPAGGTATASFENRYSTSGDALIVAYKRLVGGTPQAGQFSFELLDADGRVVATAECADADMGETVVDYETGEDVPNEHRGLAPIRFDALEIDAPGTYEFSIREVADGTQPVAFDSRTLPVSVIASDNGDGTLSLSYEFGDAGDTFENVLEPGKLTISKTVTDGATDASRQVEFAFEVSLADAAGNPLSGEYAWERSDGETGTVADGGTVMLAHGQTATISGLPAGTSYEVAEAEAPGFEVASAQGEAGQIEALGTSEARFENAYSANGEAQIRVRKELAGSALTGGQFSFELYDDAGHLLQAKANGEDGMVEFDPIAYTEADDGRTFVYKVLEASGDDANVAYDLAERRVEVSVADNGDGTMRCEVTYDGEEAISVFENVWSIMMPSSGGPGIALPMMVAGALVGLAAALAGRRRREEGPSGPVPPSGIAAALLVALVASAALLGAPQAAIAEETAADKVEYPAIEKLVQEDRDGTWGKIADASALQAVPYRLDVTVPTLVAEWESYPIVVHDEMDEALELVGGSVSVALVRDGAEIALEDGLWELIAPEAGRWSVAIDLVEAGARGGDVLRIAYDARLVPGKLACGLAGAAQNVARVEYPEDPDVPDVTVTSPGVDAELACWEVLVRKVDGDGKPLAGAAFALRDAETGKILAKDGEWLDEWDGERCAVFSEEDGIVSFRGLDEGRYQIAEAVVPDGHVGIEGLIDVEIASDLTGSLSASAKGACELESADCASGVVTLVVENPAKPGGGDDGDDAPVTPDPPHEDGGKTPTREEVAVATADPFSPASDAPSIARTLARTGATAVGGLLLAASGIATIVAGLARRKED